MTCLPMRRLTLAIASVALTWAGFSSRMASILCSRAFCLVLRALGPWRSQASSRRKTPLNFAADAASEASSSALCWR